MPILTFNANCTSEHGESPRKATVDFTPELEARIREMMALCTEHGLSEVREWNCAAVWGGGEDFPEFLTEVDELVVVRELLVVEELLNRQATALAALVGAFDRRTHRLDRSAGPAALRTIVIPLGLDILGPRPPRRSDVERRPANLAGLARRIVLGKRSRTYSRPLRLVTARLCAGRSSLHHYRRTSDRNGWRHAVRTRQWLRGLSLGRLLFRDWR